MSSRDWEGAGAGAGAAALVAIVLAVILLWLTVKTVELIARTIVAHSDNVFLRAAVALVLVFTLLASVASGFAVEAAIIFSSLAGASFLGLVMVCKVLEVYYAPVLELEWNRDAVSNAVLHEPWWMPA